MKPPVRDAIISPCGKYRYLLTRTWNRVDPSLCFIMLNPSTADASIDDPTIRRCIGFARQFGYGGIRVVNLYALRATDPKELWRVDDPVGPENDGRIVYAATDCDVILAYGSHAKPKRIREVLSLLKECEATTYALKLTRKGNPQHPLYLPNASKMIPYP